jgi:hypothetical protein
VLQVIREAIAEELQVRAITSLQLELRRTARCPLGETLCHESGSDPLGPRAIARPAAGGRQHLPGDATLAQGVDETPPAFPVRTGEL